jgi:AcrR family transcriptional regulator
LSSDNVKEELDAVKGAPHTRAMPAGRLPDALRAAAVEVINEKGLSGFSLREVTRRAWVSHAAPAYHFHNAAGLLTSLATEAFVHLRQTLEAAGAGIDDPIERFIAIGQGYVRAGTEYPAHCEVAFRTDMLDNDNAELQAAGLAAYGILESTIRAVAEAYNPALDVNAAANLAWSAMQGLLVLHPKISRVSALQGRDESDIEATAATFCRLLADGFVAR